MNKIYKVVWSKVKNCYVVVSEIAKNVITGSVKSAKVGAAPMVKGMAMGVLAAFMISGSVSAEVVDYDHTTNKLDPVSQEQIDSIKKLDMKILSYTIPLGSSIVNNTIVTMN